MDFYDALLRVVAITGRRLDDGDGQNKFFFFPKASDESCTLRRSGWQLGDSHRLGLRTEPVGNVDTHR